MYARTLFLIALAVTLATLAAEPGSATRPRRPSVRAEIARLRGEIVQLSTQVNFANRRLEAMPIGGGLLCGDLCGTDSDGDGLNDCEDPCPCDPTQTDGDGDGIADCLDPCPDDATDACIDPCRMDSDRDGANDCEDPCPFDPLPARDGDGDTIPDCRDPYPADAEDGCADPCPLDQNGDGLRDCRDPCPFAGETAAPACTVFRARAARLFHAPGRPTAPMRGAG